MSKNVNHPDQAVVIDDKGVARFKSNEIVRFLLNHGPYDLNTISKMEFSDDDRNQFAQLIGCSVCEFGELSYAEDERVERADTIAQQLGGINLFLSGK